MKQIVLPAAALALALSACSSPGEEADEGGEQAQAVAPGGEDASSASAPDPAPGGAGDRLPDAGTLTPFGLGGLALGASADGLADGWAEDDVQLADDCRILHSPLYPEAYAISDGRQIRRITVGRDSQVRTARGIGGGSSEAAVRAAYPGLTELPHYYIDEPAKYLTWMPLEGEPGFRFEIGEDGLVKFVHAGLEPQIAYVEGCA